MKFNKGKYNNAAPGTVESLATVQAGGQMIRKQHCRKRSRDSDERHVPHVCGNKSEPHIGLH